MAPRLVGPGHVQRLAGPRDLRLFYTDTAGALHLVADEGDRSTDTVIRSSGFAKVTGLRGASCSSPDYSEVRTDIGLVTVNRTSGIARFQRVLRPLSPERSSVTKATRLRGSDWTWRRLG